MLNIQAKKLNNSETNFFWTKYAPQWLFYGNNSKSTHEDGLHNEKAKSSKY